MIFLQILLWILFVILGIIGLLAFLFIFIGVCSLFADRNKVYDKESKFFRFLLTYSTAIASVLIRIRLRVNGKEKLPKGRFLLVSNHRSKFDPILTWLAFGKYHIAFISKPENFKVPIYGRIIRKCCFMAIDRENPREALKTVNQAAKLMKNDEVSVGVYPEGTRNYGEMIHKNYPLHSSKVEIDVLETIEADRVKSMTTAEIGDYVSNLMLENLEGKK